MFECSEKTSDNVVRVIKISRNAIEELLWEAFMEIGEDRMEIESNNDDVVFRMVTDEHLNEVVFYACNYSCHKDPGFSQIDELIREKVEITSESLYTKPEGGKYYTDISLNEARNL